jgi:hypothetical protein
MLETNILNQPLNVGSGGQGSDSSHFPCHHTVDRSAALSFSNTIYSEMSHCEAILESRKINCVHNLWKWRKQECKPTIHNSFPPPCNGDFRGVCPHFKKLWTPLIKIFIFVITYLISLLILLCKIALRQRLAFRTDYILSNFVYEMSLIKPLLQRKMKKTVVLILWRELYF